MTQTNPDQCLQHNPKQLVFTQLGQRSIVIKTIFIH